MAVSMRSILGDRAQMSREGDRTGHIEVKFGRSKNRCP